MEEREYKEFRIGDLFDVENTWIYGKNKQWKTRYSEPVADSLPVISGTTKNNGVNYYTTDEPADDEVFHDCLTITTRGYSGTLTYHDGKFVLANNILAMPMPNLTREQQLYISAVMSRLGYGGYNHYPRKETLEEDKLLLPVTSSGAPDWAFMSDYVRSLEHDYVRSLEHDYVRSLDAYMRATGLDDYQLTEHDRQVLKEAEDKEYEEYRIGDLFVSENGDVDLKKEDITGRGYPLITSGVSNNGIAGLTDKPARVIPGNTITMDMFGYAFYRPESYKMVTHARVFSLEPLFEMNEPIGLYMTAQFAKYPQMFSYSNMCSFNKIQDNTLSLPVTSSGSIDWAFMSDYIRVMEKLVIGDVVDWKDKELKLTRELVDGSEEDGENKVPQAAGGSLA